MMRVLLMLVLLCTPGISHAATLTFGSSGTGTVGGTLHVPVRLSTGPGESANAVSASISYPPQLLELVSISKAGSIISLWAEEPSYTRGGARLEGVILNPGYSGSAGTVVTLVFRVQGAGPATVSFADAAVLANDGKGTPILQSAPALTLTLSAAPAPSAPRPPSTPAQDDSPAESAGAPQPGVEKEGLPLFPEPVVTTSPYLDKLTKTHIPLLYVLGLMLLAALVPLGVRMLLFGGRGGGTRAHKVLHSHFSELREALSSEILALEHAKTKRALSDEEERMMKRLTAMLSKTERALEREIDSIV